MLARQLINKTTKNNLNKMLLYIVRNEINLKKITFLKQKLYEKNLNSKKTINLQSIKILKYLLKYFRIKFTFHSY